jgi:hypothetical protein
MTFDRESPHAVLLAASTGVEFDATAVAWQPVVALALRERMVLRLADWFRTTRQPLPPELEEAATDARARAREVAGIVARLSPTLEKGGVPHVFLGIAQSRPDVGRDLDLLVARSTDVVLPRQPSLVPLDVQHGLGRADEHQRYSERVLQRREIMFAHPGPAMVPCPEDRLLLLALKRIYGRPSIRLADVCFAARVLDAGSFNPERLIEFAAESGLRDGLACFLEYADQVVRHFLGTPLLDAGLRSRLPAGPWGHVEFGDGAFRGSLSRVAPYLYVRLVATRIFAGDLDTAGRVVLLPLTLAVRRSRRRAGGDSQGIANA